MRRLLILLFAGSVPAPALAQHSGHAMPAAQSSRATASPAATSQRPPVDPHAGHVMPAPAAPPPPDPHAGHNMGQTAPDAAPPGLDPHAGHNMGPAESRSGEGPRHDGGNEGEVMPDPPAAAPPPAATDGPVHAADRIYPAGRMAHARAVFRDEHGAIRTHRVLIDQLEARIRGGRDGYAWDGELWYGGAIDRFRLETEGEGTFGEGVEQAEIQALWSRALDPWFNLHAGVRYDFRPDPQRAYLALGIGGLAPYWFEVDGTLFLSDHGDISARFEGEYEQRITRRLILQPRVDLDFALQDVPEIGIGSGLSTAESGLRLRYEFVPEFAPYAGVHYERAFGDTARFRRIAGEDVGGWSFVVGVRTWF